MTLQQYRLLSGVVSELVINSGEEEFIRDAGEQAVGVGIAGGLTAAGLAGAAAGAGLAAASAGDSIEFFSCKIDDQVVTGRFSKVTFKNGDQLDVVFDGARRGKVALAVRRRGDHSLWMVPHCSRGTIAHRTFALRLAVWLGVGLPTFFFSMFLVLGVWPNKEEMQGSLVQAMAALCCALGLVGAAYYSIGFYRRWYPIALQDEGLFAALGYADPATVDLERAHKLYCKSQGITWPYKSDGPWIYHYTNCSMTGQ